MVSRLSCLCCAFLGLLFLSGCATGSALNCISVSVTSVGKVTGDSFDTIPVAVRFANENVIAVGASDTFHKLYLNGVYVGECRSHKPVGMQAEATVTEVLPFTIKKPDYVRQLALAGKLVNYEIDSRIDVYIDTEHLEVKPSHKGTLDLSPLLGAK